VLDSPAEKVFLLDSRVVHSWKRLAQRQFMIAGQRSTSPSATELARTIPSFRVGLSAGL
jgi:hypothetical protein